MTKPLVSIITPAYNAGKFIGETIESVQMQTLSDWEMVIADDGSKDDTVAIVERMAHADPRIRLVRLGGNSGPALARNAALEQARGRFVSFLDSDDLWLAHKLETQVEYMLKNRAALAFSQYRRITQDGASVGRLIPVPEKVSYSGLLKHNVIATLTTMVDTALTGPIRMTNEGYDDFILWLEILRKGFEAHGLQQDLARYRVVMGSVSHKKMRAARWVWNIYRRVEKLPLPLVCWNFGNYVCRVSLKHSKF